MKNGSNQQLNENAHFKIHQAVKGLDCWTNQVTAR